MRIDVIAIRLRYQAQYLGAAWSTRGCRVTRRSGDALPPSRRPRPPAPTASSCRTGPAIPPPRPMYAADAVRKPDRPQARFSGSVSAIKSSGWRWAGKTYKLKFGHHGGNQPVMDLTTQQGGDHLVRITASPSSADSPCARSPEVTHVNLNDDTVEGLTSHEASRCSAIQYHPEASPGPHDAELLCFERFAELIEDNPSAYPLGRAEIGGDQGACRSVPTFDKHLADRLGADRHRPGVRVRLLRHTSLQGPYARTATEIILVNSNPATIMTDPDFARPHLHRADRRRGRREDHRGRTSPTRCCRRSADRPRLNTGDGVGRAGRSRERMASS